MANYDKLPAPSPEQGLNRYLQEIRKFPLLEPEEEYMLAKAWVDHGDKEAAHQFRARVGRFFVVGLLHRQQHARLDLDQHRRHQQVFRRQIKLICLHLGNIVQILLGNLHHRNIKDIDILLADEVQQQIQRPLEAAQYHLQRIRRNKQILRHISNRLTEHPRNGMFRRRCSSGRNKVF